MAILLCAGCSGNDADQSSRPNILLILTDDLGNNDIGSWGDGVAPTPTLDQLSQRSVRFRQHYTDSTCSPSRAALLTGLEPTRIGFQPTALGLSMDLHTLPKQLRQLGYRTSHVGKWHVGEALEYSTIQPSQQGFDYWFGMLNHFVLQGPNAKGQLVRNRPTHWNPWLQENGTPPRQYQGYLDDILTNRAIGLLERRGDQPWFINLWLYSPHTPYQPPAEDAARFSRTPEGRYLAVLARLDKNVARLLQALDESGQAENTIVVFTSDNGGTNKVRNNNWPFTGVKTEYLEGGQRAPLLVYWPKRYLDRDIEIPSSITDIYPTLIDLAGGSDPNDLDGRSLVGAMDGDVGMLHERLFFAAPDNRFGMSYGGRIFSEQRMFYQSFLGGLQSMTVAPPIGSQQKAPTTEAFTTQQALRRITNWERSVRQPGFSWQPAGSGYPASLSGLSMQRAPVFGGYSLGLALRPPVFSGRVQTLVEQEGVWQVSLMADRRLRIRHSGVEQLSAPLSAEQVCNRLIIGVYVAEAISIPFRKPAEAKLKVSWNGQSVLESTRLLRRPSDEGALSRPTYIGGRRNGSEAYAGGIDQPIVINKLLYSGQPGYSLDDLDQSLCAAAP
ncbi:sulfatase-like hydrolase/transferase [Pseudomonas subflava]|uniref:sulfatase-like hydrolase/transferase n=1 Tax=Pseudomonas subflava TaxID=2952933 RepID=UPI00207B0169